MCKIYGSKSSRLKIYIPNKEKVLFFFLIKKKIKIKYKIFNHLLLFLNELGKFNLFLQHKYKYNFKKAALCLLP